MLGIIISLGISLCIYLAARNKLNRHTIQMIITLVIFSIGVIPILPNRTIDPWSLFNPRNFAILIVTISVIQIAGYVSMRLFGERLGMAITGFLGGLVSSTAVFASFGSTLRTHPGFALPIMASALLATLAMLAEIMTIIFIASPSLFLFIIKPVFFMSITSIIFSIALLYFQKIKLHKPKLISSSFSLLSVLRVSFFIAATLILVAIAKRFVGPDAVLLISFLGGLFEIHGITLATALLYLDHQIAIDTARSVLYIAIFASFVSKLFLLWSLTPARFALYTSLLLIGILVSGVLGGCLI
jgi:uncharacterized membrane protein (DUF4010 family)